jgi:hypothetical protein
VRDGRGWVGWGWRRCLTTGTAPERLSSGGACPPFRITPPDPSRLQAHAILVLLCQGRPARARSGAGTLARVLRFLPARKCGSLRVRGRARVHSV